MKNKMIRRGIAALLLLCALCTCLPLPALAAEQTEADEPDLTVPDGLENLITPEDYIDRRGSAGYDGLRLLGVGAPRFTIHDDEGNPETTVYQYFFKVYLYNPDLEDFLVDYDVNMGSSAGQIFYKDNWHDEFRPSPLMAERLPDGFNPDMDTSFLIENRLFPAFECVGTFQLGDKKLPDVFFEFSDMTLTLSDGRTAVFTIDRSLEFVSVEEEIVVGEECRLDRSRPLEDLSTFLNVDQQTIKKMYPRKAADPLFFYDFSAKQIIFYFSERDVYLYIYDGDVYEDHPDDEIMIFVKDEDDRSYSFPFTLVNCEETVIKCKCPWTAMSEGKTLSSLFDSGFTLSGFQYSTVGGILHFGGETMKYTVRDSLDSEGKRYKTISADSTEIKLIDVGSTYYKLNSSTQGKYYMPTLSTVYFSIPAEYFEVASVDILNHRWIESISGKYAFTTVNGVYDQKDSQLYNAIDRYGFKGTNGITVFSNPSTTRTGVALSIRKCDFVFGETEYDCDKKSSAPIMLICADTIPEDYQLLLTRADIEWYILQFYKDAVSYEDVSFVIDKDTTYNLLSRKELSFWDASVQYGFFETLWRSIFGDSQADDSIKNIPAFVTLRDQELQAAYLLPDETFSSTYLVSAEEVSQVKAAMKNAFEKNEVFTLFRFDFYNSYSCNNVGYVGNDILSHLYPRFKQDGVVFEDRYYKDFKILEMELRNHYDTKVYTVAMQPISFAGSGVYTPIKPLDGEVMIQDVENSINNIVGMITGFFDSTVSWWEANKKKVIAIVSVALILVLVAIFHRPIVLFVQLVSRGVKKVREKAELRKHRKRQKKEEKK